MARAVYGGLTSVLPTGSSEPRNGRPKTVDDAAIIAATLDPPPESLAVTHWSGPAWEAKVVGGEGS